MISETKAIARVWLASYWPRRSRARELARQYGAMAENKLAIADMARFCCAFDSTFVPGDREMTMINTGKREAWLHLQAMLGLDHTDLEGLKEETELG